MVLRGWLFTDLIAPRCCSAGWLQQQISNFPIALGEQLRPPYMLLLTAAVLRAAESLLLDDARRDRGSRSSSKSSRPARLIPVY